jgi:hypothetical protein
MTLSIRFLDENYEPEVAHGLIALDDYIEDLSEWILEFAQISAVCNA